MTVADLLRTSLAGFRIRRLRAALAALGVAIGIASMVAVTGISASSKAALIAELDRLGTNLLQVQPGQGFDGQRSQLPTTAAPMLARVAGVTAVAPLEQLAVNVYRSEQVPAYDSNGISTFTADSAAPSALGLHLRDGVFLNQATSAYPVVVLGAAAAERLGIDRLHRGLAVYLGGHRFTVAGIADPLPLTPDLDAAAFIGPGVGATVLHATGHASAIYVRTDPNQVLAASALVGPTADPEHPDQVVVLRPSDAIAARAAAKSTFTTLFLGLGAVALLVGGIGIANIMVIGVLERRREIGLRRALGATRTHIRGQFLVESLLLSLLGGLAGTAAGAAATALFARERHWQIVVPFHAVVLALAATLLVGAAAGLYPALRAARLAPADALRTA